MVPLYGAGWVGKIGQREGRIAQLHDTLLCKDLPTGPRDVQEVSEEFASCESSLSLVLFGRHVSSPFPCTLDTGSPMNIINQVGKDL